MGRTRHAEAMLCNQEVHHLWKKHPTTMKKPLRTDLAPTSLECVLSSSSTSSEIQSGLDSCHSSSKSLKADKLPKIAIYKLTRLFQSNIFATDFTCRKRTKCSASSLICRRNLKLVILHYIAKNWWWLMLHCCRKKVCPSLGSSSTRHSVHTSLRKWWEKCKLVSGMPSRMQSLRRCGTYAICAGNSWKLKHLAIEISPNQVFEADWPNWSQHQ